MLSKQINPEVLADLDTIYDTQLIVTNNATVRFFPPGPEGSEEDSNYEDNPLPGLVDHEIIALGIEPVMPIIVDDSGNSIDVVTIYNQLARAIVELTVDGDRERVFAAPLAFFLNLSLSEYRQEIDTDYDAENTTQRTAESEILHLKGSRPRKLPDPFPLSPNKPFHLRVKFQSASGFPSASNWSTSNQGGAFGLRAVLQYGKLAA